MAQPSARTKRSAAAAKDATQPPSSPVEGSGAPARADLQVQRVRSSYTQVAEQLRDLIVRGDLAPGHRLPSEAEMAPLFGVSRSTIREALRILVTDGLVVTKRGVHGGTFVVELDAAHVEGVLSSTLNLLAMTNQVGPDDFLDAWHAIEALAAHLAAKRADPHDIEQLFQLSEPVADGAIRGDVLAQSADFHFTVLHASGNLLLEAMGRPVSAVARARLRRTTPTREFWDTVNDEHRQIAHAIAKGDADRARAATVDHIEGLRSYYSTQWRDDVGRHRKRSAASPIKR